MGAMKNLLVLVVLALLLAPVPPAAAQDVEWTGEQFVISGALAAQLKAVADDQEWKDPAAALEQVLAQLLAQMNAGRAKGRLQKSVEAALQSPEKKGRLEKEAQALAAAAAPAKEPDPPPYVVNPSDNSPRARRARALEARWARMGIVAPGSAAPGP